MPINANYPFKWLPSCPAVERERRQVFSPSSNQLNGVTSEPLQIHGPREMAKVAEAIYNFEVRPDDVWVVTYPKCGTTWVQEMVWQIVHNVNIEEAKSRPLWERTPFIEVHAQLPDLEMAKEKYDLSSMSHLETGQFLAMANSLKAAEAAPSPRVIKTHLPLEMLPPTLLQTCKVVFVGRNPKDCCVSYYHHHLNFEDYGFQGDFAQFAGLFMKGSLGYGSFWTLLKSAWKAQSHPNLKIIWFEDMKSDLPSMIREVAQFLGYVLTDYRVLKLDGHLYIDNFRQVVVESTGRSPLFKKFVRTGKVGEWRRYFIDEKMLQKWDAWIAQNLEATGIKLPPH